MNISNSEIRARALVTLGGNIFSRPWLLPIGMMLVVSIVLFAANYLCLGIGTLLLCGPLYVGLYKSFLKIARKDENLTFDCVFEGCYNFGQNLSLGIMHTLIITLWSLLLIVPGIIKYYSYAMAYYVKADNPEYTYRECLDESAYLMQGNKMKLFKLHLSMIGWFLLSILTFGIGALWLNVYMHTATAIFYDELKEQSMYE